MAELNTIARPYAEAVFSLADQAAGLTEWSAMLDALAQVARSERIRGALVDPTLSAPQLAGIILGILAGQLSAECENFVRVLAENRRLEALPEIRMQFEALKNEREGVVEADIRSALELDAAQVADLVARLEKHTGRKVKAKLSLDRELIGGVKVVIGDKVIDASARAQLTALANALRA
jgi:F-type H+-transporting ATPase subunit delta